MSCGGGGVGGRPRPRSRRLTLDVHTTTGTTFALTADAASSVEHLKKLVSRRLKVPKERICLLHRERQLRDGTLEDNGLIDGSRIILLPSVETGLLTQRPENSVMQALESLNDSQVNDFLSGKSPLNLTMRLGDHMMLIQLQLSTFPGGGVSTSSGNKTRNSSTSHRSPGKPVIPTKSSEPLLKTQKSTIILEKSASECKSSLSSLMNMPSTSSESSSSSTVNSSEVKGTSNETQNVDDFKPFLCKQDIETLQNAFEIFKSLAEMQEDIKDSENSHNEDKDDSKTSKYTYCNEGTSNESHLEDQSPIKSLSNLVSSPLKSSITSSYPPASVPNSNNSNNILQKEDKPPPPKYVPLPSSIKNNLVSKLVGNQKDNKESKNGSQSECPVITDPIAANLTSCLCSTFNSNYNCASENHVERSVPKSVNTSIEKNLCKDESFTVNNLKDQNTNSEYIPDNVTDRDLENDVDDLDCTEFLDSAKINLNRVFERVTRDAALEQAPKQQKNKRLHYLLHKTSKSGNQSIQNKPKAFMQSLVNKHLKKRMQPNNTTSDSDITRPSTSKVNPIQSSCSTSNHFEELDELPTSQNDYEDMESTSTTNLTHEPEPQSSQVSDTNSLVEASKNLTQTLKKLSKEVLTNNVDLGNKEALRPKIGQGAVIESMKHHGKGIYSGTFSGTLNPALQDRFGRPKRDISTIIHILNDLLCATPPQYRRGARITFEPTHNPHTAIRAKHRELRNSFNCTAEQSSSDDCSCNKCNNTLNMCPYGECNGHYTAPSPTSDGTLASLDVCTCKRIESDENVTSMEGCTCVSDGSTCISASTRKCKICEKQKDENHENNSSSRNCRKCNSASTLALDNSKTKCKLDQLRLVMQQKKQRREARKMKSAPYPTASNNVSISQPDQSSVINEEIETVA